MLIPQCAVCMKYNSYAKVSFNIVVSSDRSSYSDISRPLFQIFTQSIEAIDVTSVTLSRLNSINAIDVIRYLGHI